MLLFVYNFNKVFFLIQNRLVHLMDIIAHTMTRFIQIKCGSLDLWKGPFNQVEEALQSVRIYFFIFLVKTS